MARLTRESLMSLEAYAQARPEIRKQLIAHKRKRKVHLGPHLTLLFEDEQTVRYQIQEMLRIEKIFEQDGIQHELDTYNPLIPDGRNLKATMLIEYDEEQVRKRELARLIGIEDRTWVRVEGFDKIFAIADEDLDRENEDKTSAVHFLRFELHDAMAAALQGGAALAIGVDHANYTASVDPVMPAVREALVADLD